MPGRTSIVPKSLVNVRRFTFGDCREAVFARSRPPRSENVRKSSPKKQEEVSPLLAEVLAVFGGEVFTDDLAEQKQRLRRPASPESRLSGERRARTQVRRLAMAHGLSTMWTLTFAEEVTEWEQARRLFDGFVRRCKRKLGRFHRLMVPEIQEGRAASSGARVWHFHVAVSVHVRHEVLKRLWGHGFVHLAFTNKSSSKSAQKVARYIAKYAGKELGEGREGGHRYFRARGMQVPFEEMYVEPGDLSGFQEVLEDGGFRVNGEPFAVERDGFRLALWWSSERVRRGRGRGPTGDASGGGGRASPLT